MAELPDVDAWSRIRVDVPDWPGAEATSEHGSVLLEPPPPGTPYRVEEAPVLDGYIPTETFDALAAGPWGAAGFADGAPADTSVGGAGGRGVRVAVFDVQWLGAEALTEELGAFETHDCQAHPSCEVPMDTFRPRYAFEEGSHGVACAEVIRDLAPEAELHLVRVNGLTTLENAVAWAIRADIDVVSMSMSFFNNGFHDGTGPLVQAADRLADAGILLVNSAGNYATEHWSGDYVDTDADDVMDFPWGSPWWPAYWTPGTRALSVSWDQFGRCGATDLDVYVVDGSGAVVGRSEAVQDAAGDTCAPVERVRVNAEVEGWYYAQVVLRRGDPDTRLSLFARDGDAYRTTPGSMADPASSRTAFTVGAVRAVGYLANGAEVFSSRGPTNGGVSKPDIAGPDGLTTATYGSEGFYGTSASTPAVAGAVALLLSNEPGMTPLQAAERLRESTVRGTGAYELSGASWSQEDGALGAGRARLPARSPAAPLCGQGAAAVLLPLPWLLRRRRVPRASAAATMPRSESP
jgi:hypothetical protein